MVELEAAEVGRDSAGVGDEPSRPTSGRRRVIVATLVGLAIVAGVAFRLWLALGSTSRPDGDEAIPGLMALQLLRHGHLTAFYWGLPYGGSLEAIAVAPSLAVFGTNTFGLVLPSVIFGLTASWLTWRIARYFFAPEIAAAAGILSLFWPAAAVWYGTKERGFYPLSAMLGLLVVLLAVKINVEPRRPVLWAWLGLVAGLAWWLSPNIAYYAAPMALWLVLHGHWRQWRNILVAAAGLLVGSTVWWYANLHSSFASLRQPDWAGSTTYVDRFRFFWTHALPFALGLRRPWVYSWFGHGAGSPNWGRLLYFSVLLLMFVAFLVPAIRRKLWAGSPDLLLFAMSPFVFAAFVGNWHIYEGRYEYFLASMLPLVMCRVMSMRVGRVVLAVVVVVGVWTFVRLDIPRNAHAERPSTAAIAAALEAAGYRTAVANHWIAYPLTFTSDERVIASPLPGGYPPYVDQVLRSRPAYVFQVYRRKPPPQAALVATLRARHIAFRTITAGGYVAILPRTRYVPDLTVGRVSGRTHGDHVAAAVVRDHCDLHRCP